MKNRIREILTEKGFKEVVPTDQQLEKMNIESLHRFNRIIENSGKEISASEAFTFANWLSVKVNDIFAKEEIEKNNQ
jgi:nucleoside 2-deoxyribosyltransferase